MTDEQEIKVQETAIEIYRRGIREAEERIAQLKAAAPVKRPVIALVPCEWGEADGHPKYVDLRLGVHKEGCTGFAGKLDDNFYPVRSVELCTDPGEIRHWIKESGYAFTVENILKAIGL